MRKHPLTTQRQSENEKEIRVKILQSSRSAHTKATATDHKTQAKGGGEWNKASKSNKASQIQGKTSLDTAVNACQSAWKTPSFQPQHHRGNKKKKEKKQEHKGKLGLCEAAQAASKYDEISRQTSSQHTIWAVKIFWDSHPTSKQAQIFPLQEQNIKIQPPHRMAWHPNLKTKRRRGKKRYKKRASQD